MKKPWFNKRHKDCEGVDRIEIECVERWKSSHMSGDEWRFSYVARAYYKGAVVMEVWRSRLRDLVAHLPCELDRARDDGLALEWDHKRRTCCDQPGCPEKATRWFRLKQEYSMQGEGPLPETSGIGHYRKFCERHKRRGDCGLEDADSNYEEVSEADVR